MLTYSQLCTATYESKLPGCTFLADLTALSTSSSCASATSTSTSPVRGSSVSKVFPLEESTNSPSMSNCTNRARTLSHQVFYPLVQHTLDMPEHAVELLPANGMHYLVSSLEIVHVRP